MSNIFGLKSVEEMGDINGKRVLVRLDLNVPVDGTKIRDTFRIKKELPTIHYLKEKGAKIIAVSHISSIKSTEKVSLAPIAEYLSGFLGNVEFVSGDGSLPNLIEKTKTLENGKMLLLDNLRFYPGEEGNTKEFAEDLAKLADVYVNEAFSASHREHASIVSLPKLIPHFAGKLFLEEVENLSKAFAPEHPFYIIVGGAKFSTKLPLVERFLPLADKIFIVGALAHDFYAKKGIEIGKSLLDTNIDVGNLVGNGKIFLPTDVVVQSEHGKETKEVLYVKPDEVIFDAGPQSVDEIINTIGNGKLILWNGPLGNYEYGFKAGTETLAKAIAHMDAFSIVGGADTIASIQEYNLEQDFGFVSTGGGAMLDFLAKGTLPGIEALK
jgi:phosphoglycerate kinase